MHKRQTFHTWRHSCWTEQPHLSLKYLPWFKGLSPCEKRLLWLARLTPFMVWREALCVANNVYSLWTSEGQWKPCAEWRGSDPEAHTHTSPHSRMWLRACVHVFLHPAACVHTAQKGRAWLIHFPRRASTNRPQKCLFNISASVYWI